MKVKQPKTRLVWVAIPEGIDGDVQYFTEEKTAFTFANNRKWFPDGAQVQQQEVMQKSIARKGITQG